MWMPMFEVIKNFIRIFTSWNFTHFFTWFSSRSCARWLEIWQFWPWEIISFHLHWLKSHSISLYALCFMSHCWRTKRNDTTLTALSNSIVLFSILFFTLKMLRWIMNAFKTSFTFLAWKFSLEFTHWNELKTNTLQLHGFPPSPPPFLH